MLFLMLLRDMWPRMIAGMPARKEKIVRLRIPSTRLKVALLSFRTFSTGPVGGTTGYGTLGAVVCRFAPQWLQNVLLSGTCCPHWLQNMMLLSSRR
jgi:hypothetical protein